MANIDENTKQKAEEVANNLLGSMSKMINKSKGGDEID